MRPTIVLAGRESKDWSVVRAAERDLGLDPVFLVLHDGETVVNFFLHANRPESRGLRSVCQRNECDLLLLDVNLPKLDGLRVLRQLRWLRRDDLSALPPMVMLSDSCDGELIAEAYRFGASGFLCTSTNAPALRDAVQQTIRYWLGTTLRPGPRASPPRDKTESRVSSTPHDFVST